jgi:hypothetical protein
VTSAVLIEVLSGMAGAWRIGRIAGKTESL